MIKRILCLLLCLAPLTASGCATFGRSYIEFSQMDLVQALGLDLADDGSNEIIVTAISRVSGEAGDGNGSGAQKARDMAAIGPAQGVQGAHSSIPRACWRLEISTTGSLGANSPSRDQGRVSSVSSRREETWRKTRPGLSYCWFSSARPRF